MTGTKLEPKKTVAMNCRSGSERHNIRELRRETGRAGGTAHHFCVAEDRVGPDDHVRPSALQDAPRASRAKWVRACLMPSPNNKVVYVRDNSGSAKRCTCVPYLGLDP